MGISVSLFIWSFFSAKVVRLPAIFKKIEKDKNKELHTKIRQSRMSNRWKMEYFLKFGTWFWQRFGHFQGKKYLKS